MTHCPSPSPSLLGLAPDEAAAQWIIRLRSEQASPEDHAAFHEWHAASETHATAFSRAESAWAVFDEPCDNPTLSALRASALAARPEPKRWLRLGGAVAIAASLLLVIGMTAGPRPLLNPQATQTTAANSSAAVDEFVTAKGERRTVQLSDGSHITLNTDSAVRVAYSSDRRLVHLLRGQALFEVAKQPQRPFVVQASDQQVTALGTIFEVRLDDNRTKVTLIEGKVVVDEAVDILPSRAATFRPTTLNPGDALVTISGAKPQLQRVDLDQQLRWREGFVEFHDTSLAEAVLEMNRYSEKPMIFREKLSDTLRVSGVFRTGNNERFASIIGEILPIEHRKSADGTVELIGRH